MPESWGLTAAGLSLCDCIQAADTDRRRAGARRLHELLGKTGAYELAQANDVASLVAHAMGDEATAAWKEAHRIVQSQMSAFMRQLDEVADRLFDAGVPVVALKNAGIARGIHDCLGCCPMGDLDLMVRRSDFRRAHQVLLDAGYQFEFRSELEDDDLDEAERAGGTEYWALLPDGNKLWLELQWRPVAGRWIRPDQEPSCDDLMARSMSIDGSKVRLLSPEDNLLQVALHTAKHTYVRAPGLRLHTDVDRIVYNQPIDWDRFVEMVCNSQLKTAVYFSLRIPSQLLGTNIPSAVFDRLRPGRTRSRLLIRWIANAGLLDPERPKFGRARYIALNSLLYDDLAGFLRGVFPSPRWMLTRYEVSSRWLLPVLYARRLLDLVFRRANM